MLKIRRVFFWASLSVANIANADFAVMPLATEFSALPVRSWKSMRDERIVKQALDFSCGSASLATLLNGQYGESLSEKDLLQALDQGEREASFDDMARVLPTFGYKAQGFASDWKQLSQLRVPVVVYLKYWGQDHFSVIRGIDSTSVWLADSSFGNRIFSRKEFLDMWYTRGVPRGDEVEGGHQGRFLVILPLQNREIDKNYFSRFLPNRASVSERLLLIRNHP